MSRVPPPGHPGAAAPGQSPSRASPGPWLEVSLEAGPLLLCYLVQRPPLRIWRGSLDASTRARLDRHAGQRWPALVLLTVGGAAYAIPWGELGVSEADTLDEASLSRWEVTVETPSNGGPPDGGRVEERGAERLLSGREEQIARLVADGRCNKEIAEELAISVHTVSTHLRRMFGKLRVHNRAAVASCWSKGNGRPGHSPIE